MNATFALPGQNRAILEFINGTKDVRKRERDLREAIKQELVKDGSGLKSTHV